MPENESTMPSPFPLEAAVNSTADLKNAELSSEEVTPNTQKTISDSKKAERDWEIVAKRKGWIKKPNKDTKAAIMWKSALLGLLTVLFGFWAKFLLQCYDPTLDLLYLNIGALVDAIYNSIVSVAGIGFFGKMKKYYDIKLEDMGVIE